MAEFRYFGLLLLFFIPTFWLVLGRQGRFVVKRLKLILASAVFGAIAYFVSIPLGADWGAWKYNYFLTSNIRFGHDLLETLIWAILGCIVLAMVVDIFATREEKKKPLI